jgi:capsular polysaccharide export protein
LGIAGFETASRADARPSPAPIDARRGVDGRDRPQSRRYLFLQGMASQFFAELGAALRERGHAVNRINFTAGDRLFWRLPGSVSYRGTLDEWPRFLEQHLNDWRVTDIILFGDWRPLHVAATRIAALRGILVHVFEEGYLRPSWITLEHGGVNNNSALPRDPEWFLNAAETLPPWRDSIPVGTSFRTRAVHDVAYNLCNWLFAWRYSGYRAHHPISAALEYAGWIRRFARGPVVRRRTRAALETLGAGQRQYYFVPLQLDGDSQLRINSRFGSLAPAIEEIVESFARYAPPETLLVLKEHPLDSQLSDWRRLVISIAARHGIGDRVLYLVGSDISDLVRRSAGVITVNSTSGFVALTLGRPVVTLAQPIYDLPGLTFQAGLDRFWREGSAPDPVLFDAFRRVVVDRTQINGGFFTPQGLKLAVAGAVERLEASALTQPLTTISPVPVRPPETIDAGVGAESRGAD